MEELFLSLLLGSRGQQNFSEIQTSRHSLSEKNELFFQNVLKTVFIEIDFAGKTLQQNFLEIQQDPDISENTVRFLFFIVESFLLEDAPLRENFMESLLIDTIREFRNADSRKERRRTIDNFLEEIIEIEFSSL